MAKTIAVADQQTTGIERLKAQPERLTTFLKDVRAEMRKVVAPPWPEVQSTTAVVIITTFIFAGYFALIDFAFGNGVTQLIQYFTKH